MAKKSKNLSFLEPTAVCRGVVAYYNYEFLSNLGRERLRFPPKNILGGVSYFSAKNAE